MLQLDERNWAKRMFGGAQLGDSRRTARLVLCAGLQARQAGDSSLATCGGDTAVAEGLYRLMNSEHFDTSAITRAGCLATVASLPETGDILAIQDTTTLSYAKRLSPQLGPVGGKNSSKTQGIHVHSTLLVAPETGETIGLAHQQFWIRDEEPTVPKGQEDTRPPEERESFKWFQGDKVALERLGSAAARTISVCDREADITEYLSGKVARGERVVARSLHNRLVVGDERKLRKAIKKWRLSPVPSCISRSVAGPMPARPGMQPSPCAAGELPLPQRACRQNSALRSTSCGFTRPSPRTGKKRWIGCCSRPSRSPASWAPCAY